MHPWILVSAAWGLLVLHAPAGALTFPPDVDYLLRVRRAIPHLVTDAPDHAVDLPRLLGQRARVAARLGNLHRRDDQYQTIAVEQSEVRPIVKVEPLPAAVDQFSAEVRAIDATLPAAPSARRSALLERVRRDLAAPEPALVRFALRELARAATTAGDAAITPEDLAIFSSTSNLKRHVRALEQALAWVHVEGVPGPFHALLPSLTAGLFDRRRTTENFVRDRLILAEMHPELAVFKGILGADCTTRCCFGYPYARFERVFAVLDPRSRFLGYAAISRTTVEGRPTYYVNCINGRRLGRQRTSLVLRGLAALLDDRVDQMALPASEGVEANFNFPEIRAGVNRLVGDAPVRRQKFLDDLDRWRIQYVTEKFEHHFEAIYKNEMVRLLPRAALEDASVSVSVSAGSPFERLDPAEPTAREFLTMVLEALGARQFSLARRLWRDVTGELRTIDLLTEEITNAKLRPEAEFVLRVRQVLAAFDLGDPAAFVANHPEILANGRLVAADAFHPARRAATIDTLLRELGRQRERLKAGDWPALELALYRLDDEARADLVRRTREARRVAQNRVRTKWLYQIRSDHVYEDLLRLAGCENSLARENAG